MRQEFESVQQLRQHYDAISARLRNPPRPVSDRGINLTGKQQWSEPELVSLPRPPIPDRLIAEAAMFGGPTVPMIRNAVCRHFNISITDIESQRREAKITRPRQIAMYLCRTLTTASFQRIGKFFGDRDHSTILHAARKVERLMIDDADLRAEVEKIAQSVGGEL